jgi:hypothetical protein
MEDWIEWISEHKKLLKECVEEYYNSVEKGDLDLNHYLIALYHGADALAEKAIESAKDVEQIKEIEDIEWNFETLETFHMLDGELPNDSEEFRTLVPSNKWEELVYKLDCNNPSLARSSELFHVEIGLKESLYAKNFFYVIDKFIVLAIESAGIKELKGEEAEKVWMSIYEKIFD